MDYAEKVFVESTSSLPEQKEVIIILVWYQAVAWTWTFLLKKIHYLRYSTLEFNRRERTLFWIDQQGISIRILLWHRGNQLDSWLAECWVLIFILYLFGGLQKSAGGGPWVSAILRRTANSLDPSLVTSHTVILGPQGGTEMETELRSSLCTLASWLILGAQMCFH